MSDERRSGVGAVLLGERWGGARRVPAACATPAALGGVAAHSDICRPFAGIRSSRFGVGRAEWLDSFSSDPPDTVDLSSNPNERYRIAVGDRHDR